MATAVYRIGDQPTPTLQDKQAPGEDFRKAEPEAMLPRYRASDVFTLSTHPARYRSRVKVAHGAT